MNVTICDARNRSTRTTTAPARRICASLRRRAAAVIAALGLSMLAGQPAFPHDEATPPGSGKATAAKLSAASHHDDAMTFFTNLAGHPDIRIHAAIVTVPDPVATRLGRSFDLEIAALISAFEVREYVLDGFWLTWPLAAPDGKPADDELSRLEPSFLSFRKDVWRRCAKDAVEDADQCKDAPSTEYYVLLLVGEAPTFGIHPDAFVAAAKHARELESLSNARHASLSPDHEDADGAPPAGNHAVDRKQPISPTFHLDVIGPSFSGSMRSLMHALDHIAADARKECPASTDRNAKQPGCQRLEARVLSPSATVTSNANVNNEQFKRDSNLNLTYRALAADQCTQLHALFKYLNDEQHIPATNVAILAEESSFGLGAGAECTDQAAADSQGSQLRVLQFPQNIASIRAEHAQLTKADHSAQAALIPTSKFLELDMTGVALGRDLPPPYQSSLSTRSDELVLHQMLDALATYRRPAATIVIATDIRDRLFLLNEIKTALPTTLPVVLEADNLMVHPDYRQLSRGSIVVGAGDTLVCVNSDKSRKEISCRSKRTDEAQADVTTKPLCKAKDATERGVARQYFRFATDYAANTFRAALQLTDPGSSAEEPKVLSECPQLMVSTLAGFQKIGDFASTGIPNDAAASGMLLSSENHADVWRFLMPVLAITSLVFLLIARWIGADRKGFRVLVQLPRHSIHALGDRVSRCMRWIADRASGEVRTKTAGSQTASPDHPRLTAIRCFAVAVAGVAFVGLWGAALRTREFHGHGPDDRFDDVLLLLHGRDYVALITVAAMLWCVILISSLRVLIWNDQCRRLAGAEGIPATLADRMREGGYFRGLFAAVVLIAGIALSADGYSAYTVDPQLLQILLGVLALAAGIYFLVQLGFQLTRLQHLSRELARGLPAIQDKIKQADWPTPLALGQSPTNPLNIVLYPDDIERLQTDDVTDWGSRAFAILGGKWPFDGPPTKPTFDMWQRYLVAHMKAGTSVLRGCAWAALGAPIVLLVMLQVYPAPYERLQEMAAIGLMALSFCAVAVTILRLEKDVLLGRMFTKDPDRVSLGETLGALLPKLIVVLVVLTSVFAPDLLSWLSSLTKALGAVH